MTELPPGKCGPSATIVRVEAIAAKFAAIDSLDYPQLEEQVERQPRLREMLLFIEWRARRRGGLVGFAAEILKQFPERVGTKTLREAKGERLTVEQKVAIYNELPSCVSQGIQPGRDSHAADQTTALALLQCNSAAEVAALEAEDQWDLEAALKDWDRALFKALCEKAALERMPHYLASLCNEIDHGFEERLIAGFDSAPNQWRIGETWYFDDVIGAVLRMMDLRAGRNQERLGRTALSRNLIDNVRYAQGESCLVAIEEDTRFGQDEIAQVLCLSYPGQMRAVTVPSSNTLADLLHAVADGLGIGYAQGVTQSQLADKIGFVLKHTRMLLVLRFAEFLVPQNYARNTAPARLNWVRTEILNRGLPLVILVRPQRLCRGAEKGMHVKPESFCIEADRFARRTGYDMTRFKPALLVPLPDEISRQDLVEAARIRFPELSAGCVEKISSQAVLCENYMEAFEAIAKRTRWIAAQGGRTAPSREDVHLAISEVIRAAPVVAPALQLPATTAPRQAQETAMQSPRKRVVRPLQSTCKQEKTARPESGFGDRSQSISASRSLRIAGPETAPAPPALAGA